METDNHKESLRESLHVSAQITKLSTQVTHQSIPSAHEWGVEQRWSLIWSPLRLVGELFQWSSDLSIHKCSIDYSFCLHLKAIYWALEKWHRTSQASTYVNTSGVIYAGTGTATEQFSMCTVFHFSENLAVISPAQCRPKDFSQQWVHLGEESQSPVSPVSLATFCSELWSSRFLLILSLSRLHIFSLH